jgi:hypothetical protein
MNRTKRSYYKMCVVLICPLAVWLGSVGKANSMLKALSVSAGIAVANIHFTIATQVIQTSKRNHE